MILALFVWTVLGFMVGVSLQATILDNLFKLKACITLLLCGPLMWLVLLAAGGFVRLSTLLESFENWIER